MAQNHYTIVKKFEETYYYNNYSVCKDVGKTLATLAKRWQICRRFANPAN